MNPVHPETGRRLDKGHFRWTNIRKLNDQLMRENGIPVVERRGPKTAQIHHKAMKMLVNGEVPVTYDLIQKLDVARSVSRNLEEFKMVLGKFGIQTRIAGETISYTHPDRKKACKARTLGTNYTLDSINKNLEYNADAYRSKPWLLDEQIKRLDSVENKKSVNHGSFHFINYIDQTGHQVIQERAEFLRNLPNLVKQRNFNNLYRKVGTLLRDSGDERSSTQRALLSDFKQQKEERELSLSISPQENKQRSKSDHSLEIEQDDFGIDL